MLIKPCRFKTCANVCIFEVLGRVNISGHWRPYGIDDDNDGIKLPDICLKGEEKPRKNLTEETCPVRGSNPDPLRDWRASYRLAHSDVQI